VRPKGQAEFGTKVEVKNMNSFSNMQKAIEFEIDRQVALIRAGRGAEVVQETRLWDEARQETTSMRKKEGLADYRYFPEPDLPDLVVTDEDISAARAAMAELPGEKRARYLGLGLPLADVLILADELGTADYFDATLKAGAPAKAAANWIMGDLMAACKEAKCGMEALKLSPAALAETIALIDAGVISGKIAKDALPRLLAGEANAGVRAFVEAEGLVQISGACLVGRQKVSWCFFTAFLCLKPKLIASSCTTPPRPKLILTSPSPPHITQKKTRRRRRRGDGGRRARGQPQAARRVRGRQDQARGLLHGPGDEGLRRARQPGPDAGVAGAQAARGGRRGGRRRRRGAGRVKRFCLLATGGQE
jgi:hypothetical protein